MKIKCVKLEFIRFKKYAIIQSMIKALKTNRLVHHPAYPKILLQYNALLKNNGKVNDKKFYEEIVVKEIPGYHMQSWYQFLKRFKTSVGIVAADTTPVAPKPVAPGFTRTSMQEELSKTLMNNQVATSTGIQRALNIGSDRLQQIMDNPELMSAKDAIDLLFKAMKAQDSRIHAIGKVREDNREEEKLNRAFSDAAYE